jgi:tetratricopeptide (TPR) repeat protein
MADVFLSYARASLAGARRLADCLRSAGYSVWFDEHLPAHRAYAEVIEEELDQAAAVVVLWSAEAVKSQWVRSEANRARESGRLVQLRLDDARLPMPFDQVQCADVSRWHGEVDHEGFRTLLASVAALVGRLGHAGQGAALVQPSSRRNLLLGSGAAVAATALGYIGWREFGQPQPSPRAQLLLQKGMDALQSNDALETEEPGSASQAIALLTDAAEADPRSGIAWGALAMAYAVAKRNALPADRSGLEARSRSAAQRALAIDPDEVRAIAALRMLEPLYRNWLAAEREGRKALQRQPRYPILLFLLSDMLGSVGRWREAAELSRRLDRSRFLIAGADRKVLINLWSAGDLQGADEAMRIAADHWPQHPQIWRTRVAYLLFSGRAGEATALIDNPAERPPGASSAQLAAMRETAATLRDGATANPPISAKLAYLRETPSAALPVAQACSAVGAAAAAMSVLRGYYFGEGTWRAVAPVGGDADRLTGALFQPPMRSLWPIAEFNSLLGRIGLNDYWARSGTQPDFRT